MDPIHHLNSIIEKIDVKTDIALSELRNLTKKFSDLNARVKDLESCSGKTDGKFELPQLPFQTVRLHFRHLRPATGRNRKWNRWFERSRSVEA